ncbi:hypothetical protein ACRALDRAFT_1061508, partial [Sodiomyces alcalophilus JCM 7366]|uniref:uncharacterized protein n=1 Tax=Sodiomyces alcalophilus JCM 7366 TaxID=591952 RepID=UPI0039B6A3A3
MGKLGGPGHSTAVHRLVLRGGWSLSAQAEICFEIDSHYLREVREEGGRNDPERTPRPTDLCNLATGGGTPTRRRRNQKVLNLAADMSNPCGERSIL